MSNKMTKPKYKIMQKQNLRRPSVLYLVFDIRNFIRNLIFVTSHLIASTKNFHT